LHGLVETQLRSFGTRCLRFKWCVTAPACKARFRPVVSLCREGVEPSGFRRKVSIRYIGLPPFPDLSWRYRKSPARIPATCKIPMTPPRDRPRPDALDP